MNRIAVIGAGLGGLAAALALHQRGFAVRIYEQASALGEIGAGVHLSPNGIKVARALGLEPALMAIAARPRAIATRHYATGIANFEGPLDEGFEARFGAPFCSFHRADLHGVLSAAVQDAGIGIELNCRAENLREDEAAVSIEFANGRTIETDIVIGADGVHSRIRASRFGLDSARFTGHVAYRGLVATDSLAAGLIEPKLNIWVGPGRHFVAYPVRRGELINYVALVEEEGWTDETWTALADKTTLAGAFEGWHSSVRTLVDLTLRGQCYKWALLVRDPLPRWSSARATLLGDAAHPMVPYLAQGAVMAVEDAWVLAACLAAETDIGLALANYEAARLERTARVQAAAWEQGQLNHAVGRETEGDEFRGGRFADPGWIYSYDAPALYPA